MLDTHVINCDKNPSIILAKGTGEGQLKLWSGKEM